jgi:hypothetical protein
MNASDSEPPRGRRLTKRVVAVIGAGLAVLLTAIITAFGTNLFDSATAASPVHVAIEPDVDQISDGPTAVGGEYWFPVGPTRLPSPPQGLDSCVGRYEWSRRNGGVDAGQTVIRLVVSTSGNTALAITGFQVHVTSRQPAPTTGVVASCPGRGAGGPSQVHLIDADLDVSPVTTISYPAGSERPDPTFAFTLSPNESQILEVIATTNRCKCEWEATLSASVEGATRHFLITDHGHPFATTARLGKIVRFHNSRWIVEGPQLPVE